VFVALCMLWNFLLFCYDQGCRAEAPELGILPGAGAQIKI